MVAVSIITVTTLLLAHAVLYYYDDRFSELFSGFLQQRVFRIVHGSLLYVLV